jgi:nicotinamidase/pyrazinamidase
MLFDLLNLQETAYPLDGRLFRGYDPLPNRFVQTIIAPLSKGGIFMKIITIIATALILGGIMSAGITGPALAGGDTAVIVVDLQGDFTTWKKGSLAVEGSDEAFVKKVQDSTKAMAIKGIPIYATQDWHPADHISFFSNHEGKKPFEVIQIEDRTQVLWPPHCVQNTENAKILMDPTIFAAVVQKGKNPKYDSYSGFQDDGGQTTEMDEILRKNGVRNLIVYGIATDYCVKATAIDAVDAGYNVTVITGLCKGVAADTSAKALDEMKAKGITIQEEL